MPPTPENFARFTSPSDKESRLPVHVVWEITLACNLKCSHCGSRAGKARSNELYTQECLDLIDSLTKLGTRELTLIGGEAYLRSDWVEIVRAAKKSGLFVTVQTGGRSLTAERLLPAVDAGLDGIGVSIDGIEETHDRLRGVKGAYKSAINALDVAKKNNLRISVNTQICSANKTELGKIKDAIVVTGATHWQVQLTVAMGNAADNDSLLIQPYELDGLISILADLYLEGLDQGLLLVPGNNIGYFGPFEHLWRGTYEQSPHWTACGAGTTVMGIEADGTIKGCPSLATRDYGAGNVRDLALEKIWKGSERLTSDKRLGKDELWGFCKTCYYADICQGGCNWTSHSLTGRAGNNPYCHHRVIDLGKRGLRERIVKTEDASKESFGIGKFSIVQEKVPESTSLNDQTLNPLVEEILVRSKSANAGNGALQQCKSCNCFVYIGEVECVFCSKNLQKSEQEYLNNNLKTENIMRILTHWINSDQS